MKNLDVHILVLDNKLEHYKQTVDELSAVANVWVVPGIFNQLGKARDYGFSLGTAPYVSFADPMDIYFPEAFTACVERLEKKPNLGFVYTEEYPKVRETAVPFFHGVIVYRRANLVSAPVQRAFVEQIRCLEMALTSDFEQLPIIGRVWVKHLNQTHLNASLLDHQMYGQAKVKYLNHLRLKK